MKWDKFLEIVADVVAPIGACEMPGPGDRFFKSERRIYIIATSSLTKKQDRSQPSHPLYRGWTDLLPSGFDGGDLEEPDWSRLNELLYRNYRNLISLLIRRHVSEHEFEEQCDD